VDAIDTGLLILRVVTGITLAAHGYQKMFRGGRIAGTARWFDSIGMKPGRIHAYAASLTEMGTGLLFALGLLTPLAAAGMIAVMIVAGWTSHRKNGFFIVGDGWEYNMILAVIAFSVAVTGPGRYSVDHAIDCGVLGAVGSGWTALIAGGVGIVAAIGQLVLFYRPPAATE
jgi:putative oxidoreductase